MELSVEEVIETIVVTIVTCGLVLVLKHIFTMM